MDGELDARAAQRELNRLEPGSELREHWDSYHLIGDALRGEPILSRAFGHRLSERLAGEPTVLAPRRSVARRVTTYALSAAASLSAVALVGWVAITTQTPIVPAGAIATAPVPARVDAARAPKVQPASVPYDETHNEYLMAHTGFSPSTAIQGVAPYIRSVAASQPATSR
jgi:sigma-E factor negative regulatory protein RseA